MALIGIARAKTHEHSTIFCLKVFLKKNYLINYLLRSEAALLLRELLVVVLLFKELFRRGEEGPTLIHALLHAEH